MRESIPCLTLRVSFPCVRLIGDGYGTFLIAKFPYTLRFVLKPIEVREYWVICETNMLL
jgi:hypothetical protein